MAGRAATESEPESRKAKAERWRKIHVEIAKRRAAEQRAWAQRRLARTDILSWEERHPEAAAEERALRKQRRAIRKGFSHKVHGTPETHYRAAQVHQGAMARLFMSGSINEDQLAWSAEIRAVAERIGRDVAIGTVSFETRVDQSRSGDGTFFERLGAVRAEVAYTRWRAALPAPEIVLAIIVEDLACSAAARRFHKNTRTVRKLLTDALDAWPYWQRDARDEIDHDALSAAHAAIA